jgi:ribosomal protein L32
MAKILEHVKAKPTVCKCCGAYYQWEEGDKMEVVKAISYYEPIVVARLAECPSCGYYNNIELIKEN